MSLAADHGHSALGAAEHEDGHPAHQVDWGAREGPYLALMS
jgi:hypothetical protein